MKPLLTALLAAATALQSALSEAIAADATPETPAPVTPKAVKAPKAEKVETPAPAAAGGLPDLTKEDIKTACGHIAGTECAPKVKAWVKKTLGKDSITAVEPKDYPALLDAIQKSALKNLKLVVPDPRVPVEAEAVAEEPSDEDML